MADASDDLVFDREPPDDDGPQVAEESYLVDGETVDVAIRAEETTISYASGSAQSVPTDEMTFCPECMKDGSYPLGQGPGICPEHDAELVPLSLEDYERFQLLQQYELGYGGL